ncbi:hypothetical protein PSN45_004305 [Yamadazyma tenuis]|uniref:uncharacterized protein n=1 Tax=Candida tenuis TaxID=2315449 RepID=UPI00279CF6CE|nr:hypothetical protein PSN45_004305 [Yamadazyma tenuis]
MSDYYDGSSGSYSNNQDSGSHGMNSIANSDNSYRPKYKRKPNKHYDRYDPKKHKLSGQGSSYHPGASSSTNSGGSSYTPNYGNSTSERTNPYYDRRNENRNGPYDDYRKPRPAFELNSLKSRSSSVERRDKSHEWERDSYSPSPSIASSADADSFTRDRSSDDPGSRNRSKSADPESNTPRVSSERRESVVSENHLTDVLENDEEEKYQETPTLSGDAPGEQVEVSKVPVEKEQKEVHKSETEDQVLKQESNSSARSAPIESESAGLTSDIVHKEDTSVDTITGYKNTDSKEHKEPSDLPQAPTPHLHHPLSATGSLDSPLTFVPSVATSALSSAPVASDLDPKINAIVKDYESDMEFDSDAETVVSDSLPSTEYSSRLMKRIFPEKSKKPYVLKRDSSGSSLLQRACKKGNLEEVKSFIERGADANESDFCGFTCLHEAALNGDVEIVKYLIEHGADVNKQALPDGDLETPLIDAADNKHLEIVKILLDNGADPRIFNRDGFTALTKIHNQHQGEEGYGEVIQLLEEANNRFLEKSESHNNQITFQKSPSPNTIIEDPNDNYFSELLKKKNHTAQVYKYAAEGIKDLAVQYLVEGGRLDLKPDILILAARNGHLELVEIMLGLVEDYDINLKNKCGLTPLLASVGRGHHDVIQLLLDRGADPFLKRRQDDLNALEISQRSPNFDSKEIEMLENNMKVNHNLSVSPKHFASSSTNESKEPEREKKTKSLSDSNEKKLKKVKSRDEPKRNEVPNLNKSISRDIEKDEPLNIKPQISTLFKDKAEIKREVSEYEHSASRDQSLTPPPQIAKSFSPSPPPAELTKEEEEMRAQREKELKIYQEKSEAKKRARRDMFLKSEKEKERRREEERLKQIEQEQQMKLLKEKEDQNKIREIEEETRRVEREKEEARKKRMMDSIPVGLRYLKTGSLDRSDILKYSPIYVFNFKGSEYVLDLHLVLVTGISYLQLARTCDESDKIPTTIGDRSKLWNLFAPLLGGKRPNVPISKQLLVEGHQNFKNLEVSFIGLDKAKQVLKSDAHLAYEVIVDSNLFTQVDYENLNEFSELNISRPPVRENASIDFESSGTFIPYSFKHRPDLLKAVYEAKTTMW